MNVAILADAGNEDGSIGGAELTMREFANAAPDGVCLVNDIASADTVVIGNCVTLDPAVVDEFDGRRVVRYHHDLARHEDPDLRKWLDRNATHVFTSPFHQQAYRVYGLQGDWPNIPPALSLDKFRGGETGSGAVAIAPWQNPGKGQQELADWAVENEPVDVYGPGPYQPWGARLHNKGPLPPEDVPKVLRKYATFVHLPTWPEPFGRTVVEAWATGLRVVTNEYVGALYWIRENPDGLESAAEDFWKLVTDA